MWARFVQTLICLFEYMFTFLLISYVHCSKGWCTILGSTLMSIYQD